jgi:hypothetical protein
VIEAGETCDPPASCPATCEDGNACTIDTMTGSAANCNVACSYTAIATCADGDGCCPAGCDSATDSDCSPVCGNGVIEAGETCDPPASCPATCDDLDFCTIDTMTGSGANCNVACSYTAIVTCADGDGCCPAGCDSTTDNDCSPVCGNGVIEAGEQCEGADLDGETCVSLGHDGGVLACTAGCSFDESGCFDCAATDVTAPVASGHVPAPETQGAPVDTIIGVDLFDACGIDPATIVMTVQGFNMPVTITGSLTDVTVTHVHPGGFAPGEIVTVVVTAIDLSGNPLVETWRFSVIDQIWLSCSNSGGMPVMNMIDQADPNTNFSGFAFDHYDVGGGPGDDKRIICRFNPNVPVGALVFQAALTLWIAPPGAPAVDTTIECYRMNVVSNAVQATWNERSTGVSWSLSGANGVPADREGTAGASVTVPSGTSAWTPVEGVATPLAVDWAAGEPNHGIICINPATDTVPVFSDWGNGPPSIVVDFGPPLP